MTGDAGPERAPDDHRLPVYARVLRLRRLRLSGGLCFLLFEGMIVLAVVLALAELVSWWAVPVLPAAVALMVKVNDMLAGAASGPAPGAAAAPDAGPAPVAGRRAPRSASAAVSGRAGAGDRDVGAPVGRVEPVRQARRTPTGRPESSDGGSHAWAVDPRMTDPVGSPRQRFRQSAQRRYR